MNTQLKDERRLLIEKLIDVVPNAVVKEWSCELRIETSTKADLEAAQEYVAKEFGFRLDFWLATQRTGNFFYTSKTAAYRQLTIRHAGKPQRYILRYWYLTGEGTRIRGWVNYPHASILITDPYSVAAKTLMEEFRETYIDTDFPYRPDWYPVY